MFKYCWSQAGLTIASLGTAESLVAGFFCFNKLPAFIAGPETLRREGSPADQPFVRPSSPPETKVIIPSLLVEMNMELHFKNKSDFISGDGFLT